MWYVLAMIAFVLFAAAIVAWRTMIWMPGQRYKGPGALTDQERRIRDRLQSDLTVLATQIGERNISLRYPQLIEAAEFIERELTAAGYSPTRQEFMVGRHQVWNIEAARKGLHEPSQVVIVGAHYDTVPGSPGANDNGSAVVANLALARTFAKLELDRTARFVFFVNEEWPYYMTEDMGSLRHALRCHQSGEAVVGMISLETIGCYSDQPGSQHYPHPLLSWLYPTTGDFVAVVGNVASRRLVHEVVRGLRRVKLRSEGIAAPRFLKDIFRSDHAAFWHFGYPALMITDTANFRYVHYHEPSDTPDKIDFDVLARVVSGVSESLINLAGKAS